MVETPRPTDAELAILRVLWERGSVSVRELHDQLSVTRPSVYTTTLKMIQVMTEKGLVVREERGRQHTYRAKHPQKQMERRLVRDLIDRAFGGSTSRLVMQALATKRATPEELDEIRRLLAETEKDHE